MKQYAKLVVNTSACYGSIETISTHQTWKQAVLAGVEYRQNNPNAHMLEIYAYNQPLPNGSLETSHSLENRLFWAEIANGS